jgi:hypothetical protein
MGEQSFDWLSRLAARTRLHATNMDAIQGFGYPILGRHCRAQIS